MSPIFKVALFILLFVLTGLVLDSKPPTPTRLYLAIAFILGIVGLSLSIIL